MDSEILYSVVGILGFVIVIFLTLRNIQGKEVKSKSKKRSEIIEEYKTSLRNELEKLNDNQHARKSKKISLLKQYNDELSRNIFFDNDEVAEIITDLSKI